ncbi:MAG: hypothetical protein IKC97_08615 [Clostridia bacterium]|nr:hypothetical protein [Clostridia bacterium]
MKRLKEELLRKFLLFIFFIDFEQRFLQALTRCFARVRCIGFVAISLSFRKEMAKEREPKALMPFGNPQRANVASLSLRSCLHKVIQLQPLYWRFKEKRQYGSRTHDASAKTFAFYYAPCGRKNEMSFSCFTLKSGNTKGDPRGNVLVHFLGDFFVERQRSYIHTGTANAHEVQCERQKENPFKIKSVTPNIVYISPLICREKYHKKQYNDDRSLYIPLKGRYLLCFPIKTKLYPYKSASTTYSPA